MGGGGGWWMGVMTPETCTPHSTTGISLLTDGLFLIGLLTDKFSIVRNAQTLETILIFCLYQSHLLPLTLDQFVQ